VVTNGINNQPILVEAKPPLCGGFFSVPENVNALMLSRNP